MTNEQFEQLIETLERIEQGQNEILERINNLNLEGDGINYDGEDDYEDD